MGPTLTRIGCEDLASFATRLNSICQQGGLNEAEVLALVNQAVGAKCAQCGMLLSAQDLLTLAKPPPEPGQEGSRAKAQRNSESKQVPAEEPKIARLRSGYCARKGCESHFYEFTFREIPGMDWSILLDRADELKQAEADHGQAEAQWLKAQARRKIRQQLSRVAAGIAVIALLLLVRHWRSGGAIPIIRPLNELQIDAASTLIDGVCPECGQVHGKTNSPGKQK